MPKRPSENFELTESMVGMAESDGRGCEDGFVICKATPMEMIHCQTADKTDGGRPPPSVSETYKNMTRYERTTILISVLLLLLISSSKLISVV